MIPALQQWVASVKAHHIPNPGKVLEIGSLDVNGAVRQYFPDAKKYIGIDMQPGPGVDMILNAHSLMDEFGPQSIDTLICVDTLEHDSAFWITLENIRRVIRTGGNFIVSVPCTWGYHAYPKDYWRFQEDGFREVILGGFNIIERSAIPDSSGVLYCGYGVKI